MGEAESRGREQYEFGAENNTETKQFSADNTWIINLT